MKTIFHDKESGIKLEMKGTFANIKAQLVDNEGNVTTELEGSYSEVLEMISQLSENSEQGKEDTPSFEIGEVVEVKEGRASLGAVGYAILVDIKEDEIILQGFDKDGDFSRTWHNSIGSIKKVDK